MSQHPEFVAAPPALDAFVHADEPKLFRLYEALFSRIEQLELELRCFAPGSLDENRVFRELRALLEEYPDPENRPPLFGVPVGVKDIFRVAGQYIRCGSLVPPDVFHGDEAACVTALKNAGAVVMGLTVTAEFAFFEPGPTANPHDLGRTPGGSSSGSAAGVAAGFFPLSLGTQTVGSVIRPAGYCGVVGFKPSQGRIPAEGVVFFSRSADQVGFFYAEPKDIDTVMAASFGPWRRAKTPETLRLGLPLGPYLDQAEPDTLERLQAFLSGIGEQSGVKVELVDVNCLADIADITARHMDLISGEVCREHQRMDWFQRFAPLYRPRTAAIIENGLKIHDDRLEEGRNSMHELRRRLERLMIELNINAWAAPAAMGEAPEGLAATGAPAMNLPWTHAGLPIVSLPAGTGPNGMPLGLQFIGRFGQDEALVAMARAISGQASG